MSATRFKRSPLARLVLFMVWLSVSGALVAGVYCYAMDLPFQEIPPAVPSNNDLDDDELIEGNVHDPDPDMDEMDMNAFHPDH